MPVVPHEAGNTVTWLNAHSRERMRQLVRSVPGRFEGLSVGTIGKQRDDFFVGIKRALRLGCATVKVVFVASSFSR